MLCSPQGASKILSSCEQTEYEYRVSSVSDGPCLFAASYYGSAVVPRPVHTLGHIWRLYVSLIDGLLGRSHDVRVWAHEVLLPIVMKSIPCKENIVRLHQ